ncbi:hypothetical protein V2J09_014196 [Rumex salicifolius]
MSTTVASAGTTTALSVLDKPLHELTEDDLSQLTREDCRRFLKGKGMRRPSWNKSQAIQQVIALKSLLEPPPPSPPADLPRLASATPQHILPKATALSPPEIPTPHITSNSSSPVNELSPGDGEVPVSVKANEGGFELPVGPLALDPPREVDSAQADADNRAESLRDVDVSNLSLGQMTIFYCGKVNVYDRVPAEKAHTIMQLAASSIQFLQDELIDGKSAQWGNPCHFPGSSVKVNVIPVGTNVPHPVQTGKMREYIHQYRQEKNIPHEADIDGQTNRQVSLQRYLEKRKDRGRRFKIRKRTGLSSSSLEMYLNQQMRTQVVSGQSSPSGLSSPTQPEIVPPLRISQRMQAVLLILMTDFRQPSSSSLTKTNKQDGACSKLASLFYSLKSLKERESWNHRSFPGC